MQQQLEHELDEEEEEQSQLLAAVVVLMGAQQSLDLQAAQRANSRQYLLHGELVGHPRMLSPWLALYEAANDWGFITTMGIDVTTFHDILQAGFEDRWLTTHIERVDNPQSAAIRPSRRSLDSAGALGLGLHYLCSTTQNIALAQIFSLVPATVSRYLLMVIPTLLQTLKQMPDAQIRWLAGDEFEENSMLVEEHHPRLSGAFGTVDGLSLPVQTSNDEEMENSTYNGWKHSHNINNVIVYSATGLIIACNLNAPGSWHDSHVAQPIYKKLHSDTPDGYFLVADTAFPHGDQSIAGRIQTSMKAGTVLPEGDLDRELISFRQTCEWGNQTLQGCFRRLCVLLSCENESFRADVLECCVRLFNLRTRRIGLNEIRTVYTSAWKEGAEQERIWAGFRDMLFKDQRRNDRVARFHIQVSYE
ncbi:hypothetical protein BDN72DRAFT_873026 [Pluteus cervinus]|uniref:Uncharacterized protein n=1 Tax=Pluteus cervinus TaxID=181527 RepID=A0ACD3A1T4_9AGAR|nr:hypothetical protein BDN72DRAFT_873026 [Pluteus cervinus]